MTEFENARYRIELADGRLVLKTRNWLLAKEIIIANPELRLWDTWEEEYVNDQC